MSNEEDPPVAPYPPLVVNRASTLKSSLRPQSETNNPDKFEETPNAPPARVKYISSTKIASINTEKAKKGSILLSLQSLDLKTLASARGNPALGSIASTCLDAKSTAVLTGLTSGALCVHQLKDSISTDYFHAPKHHRPATAVKWRPGHTHAAIGLEAGGNQPSNRQRGLGRQSGDHCCFVWDVEGSRRSRSSPLVKLSPQVGVTSLSWLSEQTLAIGSQMRNIQLFDLRSTVSPITVYAHNFSVDGMERDPHMTQQFATFSKALNEPVKVWDARRMDKAVHEIRLKAESAFVVSAVKWSSREPGLLGIAYSDLLLEYDTSQSRPTLVSSIQAQSDIEDFEFYPYDKTGTLREELMPQSVLVAYDHRLEILPRSLVAPLAISPRDGKVVHGVKGVFWVHDRKYDDISATMMRRASCRGAIRYSMEILPNIQLLRNEAAEDEILRESLIRLWSWVDHVESLSDIEDDFWSRKSLIDAGAVHLISSAGTASDTEEWSEMLAVRTFTNPQRKAVLSAFGWEGYRPLSSLLSECKEIHEYERAAALAVWHGEIAASVECLQEGAVFIRDRGQAGDEHYAEMLERASLSVAGFRGGDTASTALVWRRATVNLLQKIEEEVAEQWGAKYLRGLLKFLLSLGSEVAFAEILNDPRIGLSDRVALGCRYLPGSDLMALIQMLISYCKTNGAVEGLTITGIDKDGMEILQSYVDQTADVQTASLITSRIIFPASWTHERQICDDWLNCYRELLNTWQMWQSRAMFDVERADLLRKVKTKQSGDLGTPRQPQNPARRPLQRRQESNDPDPDVRAFVPAQIDVRCNYCSSPIGLRQKDQQANQWLSKMNPILSCCPQCRKPLPRCAVCMLSLGTMNPYLELTKERSRRGGSSPDDLSSLANLPFAEWITFCMKCKHGGHSHHMVGWFAMHETCPVSGCDCECQFDA